VSSASSRMQMLSARMFQGRQLGRMQAIAGMHVGSEPQRR